MTMEFEGFKVACATDVGQKRAQNQDNLVVRPDLGLFIVADGMGGHRGGEIASAMAVEVIPRVVKELQKEADWIPGNVLVRSILTASNEIFQRSSQDAGLRGMGTTTVAALLKRDLLVLGHVGDSRCYFIQPDAIWQATRDHSLVQEKLRAGLITRDQVKTDKMKNVITRSVGFDCEIDVETYEMKVHPGDAFLLCSDGLSGLIEDQEILKILQRTVFENGDLELAVRELIAKANLNGGDDNISAVLILVTGQVTGNV